MFKSAINKLGIMRELLGFLWKRKFWWLIPMIVVLLFVGAIMVFLQGSALAPFIYPLF